jgi:hypothetical protein
VTGEVRVVLPAHLSVLASTGREVQVEVDAGADGRPTVKALLDALEARYPALRGTVRDPASGRRRPFVRFFACEDDLSHQPPGSPLPEAVAAGTEPFRIVGAMAGG